MTMLDKAALCAREPETPAPRTWRLTAPDGTLIGFVAIDRIVA